MSAIRMVVFDWAGTTVDYGSRAPLDVFREVFEEEGFSLRTEELAGPMGLEKKDHIRKLLELEQVTEGWLEKHGVTWNEQDVERLYERFEDRLKEVVASYSTLLPGVADTVEQLRREGLRIGSTTGYTSEMMEEVLPQAARGGYEPDCTVTPEQVGAGRPAPFMLMECMRRCNVYPPSAVVKVGDTVVDMEEGNNAGAWTVGVAEGSSLMGMNLEEYEGLTEEKKEAELERVARLYDEAGADYIIRSIRELPDAIAAINEEMAED